MEKDKKNNVVLLSVIGVLVVILIAIVVVILVTKKDNTGNTEGNNPSGGQTETPGGEEPTPENPSTTGDVDTVLSNLFPLYMYNCLYVLSSCEFMFILILSPILYFTLSVFIFEVFSLIFKYMFLLISLFCISFAFIWNC